MPYTSLNNPVTATNFEFTATADTTTTATVASPAVINGMTTTTPPPAGKYQLSFGTTVDHSAQAVEVVVSVFVGGAQLAHTVRSPKPRTNAIGAQSLSVPVSIDCHVTLNGSQVVEVKWGTPSGTATAHQRTLTLVRIA